MKYQIRPSLFESNSSSSHVCIKILAQKKTLEEIKESLFVDKEGKLYLFGYISSGFQRGPFKVISTFEHKLCYAICYYLAWLDPDSYEFKKRYNMLLDIAREVDSSIVSLDLPTTFEDIYEDEDGNILDEKQLVYDYKPNDYEVYYIDDDNVRKKAIFNSQRRVPNIGDIDHQSSSLLEEVLKKENISLKDFLLDSNWILIQDGDEVDTWGTMKRLGLVNTSTLEKEYRA